MKKIALLACVAALAGCDNTKKMDMWCQNPTQVVYLGCSTLFNLRYQYMKLNLCDGAKHSLEVDGEMIPMMSLRSTREEDDNVRMEFIGVRGENQRIEITCYKNEKTCFAQVPSKSGFALSCEIGELKSHQICARTIDSVVEYKDDGTIDLDIIQDMKPDGPGRTAFLYPDIRIVKLTPEDALYVSENWDYKSGIKKYTDGNEEYEKDACDVLKRLDDLRNRYKAEKMNELSEQSDVEK